MNDRRISRVDRLLSGFEQGLRGISAAPVPSSRPNPAGAATPEALTPEERGHSASLMRVNHAGEIAAQGLYHGHAAVARDPGVAKHMQAAAEEERDHLAWCEQRLAELGARPSVLRPAWYAGSWMIGAVSGILGDRWSLGFVAETERQVAEHLGSHLSRLPVEDRRSRAIVEQMRKEEERHGEQARSAGARELPPFVRRLMRISARVMTRSAYYW